MVVQHNLTAMNSNRQLGLTTRLNAKSSEKLSSGYKINRAADDAAGLAISEKMRRQIRGLSKASENVQDGVSYVQVADGALSEISDMLARMNQLCIQAATDTLTTEDRAAINQEIQQVKAECNRVFNTTTFNNKPIWDENTTDRVVVDYETKPILTWGVGTTRYSHSITETNKGAWPSNNTFSFTVNDAGTAAVMSWTGYDGVSYESNEMPLPDDEDLHSSFTWNLTSYMDYDKYPGAVGISPSMTITLDDEASRDQLIEQINSATITTSVSLGVGGEAYDTEGNQISGVYVSGGVLANSSSIPYYAGLVTRDAISGTDDDHIYGIDDDGNGSTSNLSTDSSGNMTLKFGLTLDDNSYTTENTGKITASGTSTGTVYTRAYDTSNSSSQGVWWDINYYGNNYEMAQSFSAGTSGLTSAIESALAGTGSNNSIIDDSNIGGELVIAFELASSGDDIYYTGKDGETTENGEVLSDMGNFYLHIPVSSTDTSDDVKNLISSIKGIDLQTSGVSSLTLYNSEADDYEAPIWGGTMQLNIQAGSESTDSNVIPLIYDVLNNSTLGIRSLTTETRDNALTGVMSIKSAAQIVDEQRSVFGAYQNKMEHSLKNLNNTVENTQSAESVIRDTDMAAEMVRHSNENILAQAGQSMLAQANQTNQGVLSLLQ